MDTIGLCREWLLSRRRALFINFSGRRLIARSRCRRRKIWPRAGKRIGVAAKKRTASRANWPKLAIGGRHFRFVLFFFLFYCKLLLRELYSMITHEKILALDSASSQIAPRPLSMRADDDAKFVSRVWRVYPLPDDTPVETTIDRTRQFVSPGVCTAKGKGRVRDGKGKTKNDGGKGRNCVFTRARTVFGNIFGGRSGKHVSRFDSRTRAGKIELRRAPTPELYVEKY